MMNKRLLICMLILALAIVPVLSGCEAGDAGAARSAVAEQAASPATEASAASEQQAGAASANADAPAVPYSLSDRDRAGTYEEAGATTIQLLGDGATISGSGATAEAGTVTVTAAGTYLLSGSYTGCLVVNAAKEDKVQLVLSNVSIHNTAGPAVWVQQADKVFLTLPEGTENILSDGEAYASLDESGEPDACVFSKDDLTINGKGALSVTGSYKHALVTKDDLVVVDAALTVSAVSDGLKGTDSVTVQGGALDITAGGDGVRTNNGAETDKGNIVLLDCAVSIACGNDGVHSASSAWLNPASLTVAAGDDGVHCDQNLAVSGGEVAVTDSYEGLEALALYITGGDVSVAASDDGLNAAGGADSSGQATDDPWGGRGGGMEYVAGALIQISGGTVSVNAGGDGLDSNGDLILSGGSVYVSGPENAGNGALDYNGSGTVTGGLLCAVGSAGMAQAPGGGSTQPVLSITLDSVVSGGKELTLSDAAGSVLLRFTPEKSWQSGVFSAPDLAVGETYSLSAGGDVLATVALSDTVTVSGDAGGWGMGKGGGMGGFPGGTRPDDGGQFPRGGRG